MKYALLVLGVLFATLAHADEVITYQMTGSVIEVRDNFIVVQKGDEQWEFARDLDTKGGFGIKAGDNVTVQFTLNAMSISKGNSE